jgi:gas vesicle protein
MSRGRRSIGLALSFAAGAALGAAITLLLTPESGADVRRRIRRGARAAQEELTGLASETREALGALGQDARQTMRRTATRLGSAMSATTEAFRAEAPIPKGTKLDGRS